MKLQYGNVANKCMASVIIISIKCLQSHCPICMKLSVGRASASTRFYTLVTLAPGLHCFFMLIGSVRHGAGEQPWLVLL